MAAGARLHRCDAAHGRWWLRLPARRVTGWEVGGLRPVRWKFRGARAAGALDRQDHGADEQSRGESGAAMVAGWLASRLREHRVRGTMARLHDGCARGPRRRAAAHHDGSGQQAPALLLQRVRPLPVAHVVARWEGADPHLESRSDLGNGRLLADARGARRFHAADSLRGDDVEGASGLVAGRQASGLQLVRRHAVQPALAHDERRRCAARAHVRRVRRDEPALVPRCAAHSVHLQRGWEHVAVGARHAGSGEASRGGAHTEVHRAGRRVDDQRRSTSGDVRSMRACL